MDYQGFYFVLFMLTCVNGFDDSNYVQESCRDSSLKVIIFAYERTGSTLIGDLYNHIPHVFYFFEPLRDKHGTSLRFPRPVDDLDTISLLSDTLADVLHCRFQHLSSEVLQDYLLRLRSQSLQEYFSCLNDHIYTHCISKGEYSCKRSNIRVLKTVRSTMEGIKELLMNHKECYNNFRIIHLVRDPRAQLNSLYTVMGKDRFIIWDNVAKEAGELCLRILKDIIIRQELEEEYPEIFLELQYEDMAESPLQTADKLFRFTGNISFPTSVKNWLQKSTKSEGLGVEQPFETQRVNSKQTAYKWKLNLPYKMLKIIDEQCIAVYNELGYLAINNRTELTDTEKLFRLLRT